MSSSSVGPDVVRGRDEPCRVTRLGPAAAGRRRVRLPGQWGDGIHPPQPLWASEIPIEDADLLAGDEVRHALGEDRLTLWYQPKIDVATRRLRGAEALLRLDHARLGIVAPNRFLPRFSAADLAAVTGWVAERAIADWGRFALAGLNVRLSINAPPSALEGTALPSLLEILRPSHPAWPGLTVEMTESEIIRRVDLVRRAAARLSSQQVSIAIDDFGSGYSSLVRLIEVPFSEIKIDRALVRQCAFDESIRIFLKAIRDFAHYHGAIVVAEGVETMEEFEVVAELGIDQAQGFLFARPMPAEEFLRTGAGLA